MARPQASPVTKKKKNLGKLLYLQSNAPQLLEEKSPNVKHLSKCLVKVPTVPQFKTFELHMNMETFIG